MDKVNAVNGCRWQRDSFRRTTSRPDVATLPDEANDAGGESYFPLGPKPAAGRPSSPSLPTAHRAPRVTRSRKRGSPTVALVWPMVVLKTRACFGP